MEKVERYRERILILKEDRHAKKAMVSCCVLLCFFFFFVSRCFSSQAYRLRCLQQETFFRRFDFKPIHRHHS